MLTELPQDWSAVPRRPVEELFASPGLGLDPSQVTVAYKRQLFTGRYTSRGTFAWPGVAR